MSKIAWYGHLCDAGTDSEIRAIRTLLSDFLEQTNLMCDGMAAVGYNTNACSELKPGQIGLVAFPAHNNHVDLEVCTERRYDFPMQVRVQWNCGGLFPESMGIPTRERITAGLARFNTASKASSPRPKQTSGRLFAPIKRRASFMKFGY